MPIKEIKAWETSDGMKHDTYEKAVERENELAFYKLLEPIEYDDGLINDFIEPVQLWSIKDKLIQFFIDKGYVKEIKIGVK